MFLEKVSLSGYRGIARMDMNFVEHTILIGENTWGKSSFLRALWCVLGNGDEPYNFTLEDFRKEYVEGSNEVERRKEIMFVFTFRELFVGTGLRAHHLLKFKPLWCTGSDSYNRIFYFIKGERGDNKVITTHGFLHADGSLITIDNNLALVRDLLALNPVFRLRDSRSVIGQFTQKEYESFNKDEKGTKIDEITPSLVATYEKLKDDDKNKILPTFNDNTKINNNNLNNKHNHNPNYSSQVAKQDFCAEGEGDDDANKQTECLVDKLKRLFANVVQADGEMISKDVVEDGILALKVLLEHYFSVMPPFFRKATLSYRRGTIDMVTKPLSHTNFGSLYTIFKNSTSKTIYLILAIIAGSMFLQKGARKLSIHAHPIVIFEDIESRLHPTMLHDFWNVIEILPTQEIITTNSGDLLATVPIGSIRRVTRNANVTISHEIDFKAFTEEELRKIAFHIRINRPMSLFARSWILVEGETEIWVLNEFAAILGIDLVAEGIRLVEYAQCGVAPLAKLANQLGIAWFLMADGDDAGIHYVENAKRLGNGDNVILLPDKDIEHYLFKHGFERVYRESSGYVNVRNVTKNKIIETAIKRYTKPGLALEVADDARKRGRKAIPELIQKLIAKALVSTR